MKCVAVTPEKTVVDRDVKFVVVPLFDGEYGVGEKHSAVVGRLGAGELRMTLDDGAVERWYVEGGFVEVSNDVVSLLTNRACPFDELDLESAREALESALKAPSNTPQANEIKAETVRVARARVQAAEKAAALRK